MLMENVMERALSEEKRYCANEDYILREIAGETILVPTGASADHFNGMMTLNETSRFLWELFRMPHTIDEAVTASQEQYIDPSGTLKSEVYGFVLESVRLGYFKEEE